MDGRDQRPGTGGAPGAAGRNAGLVIRCCRCATLVALWQWRFGRAGMRVAGMARRAPLFSARCAAFGVGILRQKDNTPLLPLLLPFPARTAVLESRCPVALRANHPLPHAPRLRGEWGWERPPLRSTIYSPQIRTYVRTYLRGQGSLPARACGAMYPCGKASNPPAAGVGQRPATSPTATAHRRRSGPRGPVPGPGGAGESARRRRRPDPPA